MMPRKRCHAREVGIVTAKSRTCAGPQEAYLTARNSITISIAIVDGLLRISLHILSAALPVHLLYVGEYSPTQDGLRALF